MTPQVKKHLSFVKRVADHLRESGLKVEVVNPRTGYDILVEGQIRIGVRVSFANSVNHVVTVNGKKYHYRYTNCGFNFHRHGKIVDTCDFFVCLAVFGKKLHACLVIPRTQIIGPTLSLHFGAKPYQGHYAQFADKWEQIKEASCATN